MADRRVSVEITASIDAYKRRLAEGAVVTNVFAKSVDSTSGPLGRMEKNSSRAGNEIDKLSGRLRLATDAALVLGPALGPLGAVAIAGVVGLSAQLGSLAGGLGVTLLATNGLSDGLKALNDYQLKPTAENALKLREQLEKLGPSGQRFVFFLDSITPELKELQFAARDGLLPGAEDGIQHLLVMLPRLKDLVTSFSTEVGDLLSGGGEALAGDRFRAFFDYLQSDGARILGDTARTLGNLAEAIGNLFVGFGPLTGDISGGLLEWSRGLADASKDLESNKGFQDFLDYVRTTGPQVLDTLGSLANMLVQIVQAASPLGGPVLMALEGVADAIARIADSPLGTPIFVALAALALFNRALAVTAALSETSFGGPALVKMKAYTSGLLSVTSAQERAQMSATQMEAANKRVNGSWAGYAKGTAQVGALALAMSGLADKAGLANTATLSILGPWGTLVGVGLDLADANSRVGDTLDDLDAALSSTDVGVMTEALKSANAELERMQANTVLGTSVLGDFGGSIVNTIAPLSNVDKFVGLFGGRTDDTKDKVAELNERIDEFRNGTLSAFNPVEHFGAALEKSAMAADRQRTAIQGAIDAMRDMRAEALKSANAELDYQQAIDDANQALKENGRTVDKTTDKGRNNLRALYALAGAWNGQSEVVKDNARALHAARQNFIDTAQAMGMSEDAARRLARQLFEIPTKRQIDVTLDTHGADASLRALKARMDALHDKHLNVYTNVRPVGGQAPGGGIAEGGTVAGPRRPYGDKMVHLLAPGEEVISNRYGQADRHRSLLKAINAGRLADGGTSGGRPGYLGQGGSNFATLGHEADQAATGLKGLKAALDRAEKSLDRERSARDDLIAASQDFAASVGGAYASMDPFAQGTGSPWAAASNPLNVFDSAVAGNTAATQAAQQALDFAKAHGLDGPLYAALAASGNLPLLQAFANLSAGEIEQREQAFAAQSNSQAALGGMAANAVFGQQLKESNHHLNKIRDEVRELRQDVKQASKDEQKSHKEDTANFAAAVNGAAANGHKRGH